MLITELFNHETEDFAEMFYSNAASKYPELSELKVQIDEFDKGVMEKIKAEAEKSKTVPIDVTYYIKRKNQKLIFSVDIREGLVTAELSTTLKGHKHLDLSAMLSGVVVMKSALGGDDIKNEKVKFKLEDLAKFICEEIVGLASGKDHVIKSWN